MKKRLFIALNLNQTTKHQLSKFLSESNNRHIKKVAPENLHITMQFLGDTDKQDIEKIQDLLTQISKQYQSFNIDIDNIGCFPNLHSPKIIWIGVYAKPIIQLHQKISRGLQLIIANLDNKPITPHITLARVKNKLPQSVTKQTNHQLTLLADKILPLHDKITSIDLMASQLTSQGPIYTLLSQHQLG